MAPPVARSSRGAGTKACLVCRHRVQPSNVSRSATGPGSTKGTRWSWGGSPRPGSAASARLSRLRRPRPCERWQRVHAAARGRQHPAPHSMSQPGCRHRTAPGLRTPARPARVASSCPSRPRTAGPARTPVAPDGSPPFRRRTRDREFRTRDDTGALLRRPAHPHVRDRGVLDKSPSTSPTSATSPNACCAAPPRPSSPRSA